MRALGRFGAALAALKRVTALSPAVAKDAAHPFRCAPFFAACSFP